MKVKHAPVANISTQSDQNIVHIAELIIYMGSYMSAHVYLTSWGTEIKCEACRAFYLFFATRLSNSTIHMYKSTTVRFYLSYGIKITCTLRSHFCHKNVIILSLCTQRCYGRHNVSRKSVDH